MKLELQANIYLVFSIWLCYSVNSTCHLMSTTPNDMSLRSRNASTNKFCWLNYYYIIDLRLHWTSRYFLQWGPMEILLLTRHIFKQIYSFAPQITALYSDQSTLPDLRRCHGPPIQSWPGTRRWYTCPHPLEEREGPCELELQQWVHTTPTPLPGAMISDHTCAPTRRAWHTSWCQPL